MTTPVGRDVGKSFEPMGDTMIDLFFVGVGLVVGFADTLGDDLLITFAVASILAVSTLHTGRILQEVAAKSTAHDVVKLLRNELVSLLLVDFFLLLSDGSLTVQSNVEWTAVLQLLGYTQSTSVDGLENVPGRTYQSSSTREFDQQVPMQTMNRS